MTAALLARIWDEPTDRELLRVYADWLARYPEFTSTVNSTQGADCFLSLLTGGVAGRRLEGAQRGFGLGHIRSRWEWVD